MRPPANFSLRAVHMRVHRIAGALAGLSASIPPATSDTFTVQLDSAAAGSKSGELSFTTSDVDENPFNFPLAGVVLTPPEIVVELAGNDIADGTLTAVDFGSVQEGQAGPTRVFTVRNTGGSVLTLGAPGLPPGYSIVEGLSASLGAGASDTFTLRLDTASAGTKAGQVSFTTGDADENPFNFPVTGVVTSTNTPPTISDIADRSIDEDVPTGAIGFVIGDAQTPAGSLTITRQSSNPGLVPLANIVLGGSDAVRTLTITPAGEQSGTTTITITVHDAGGAMASDSFVLTVNPVNDAPTISAIADRRIGRNVPAPFAFDLGDIETPAASLAVQVQSSNPTLVPPSAVVISGSGASRTATVTPALNQTGVCTITLIVTDGSGAPASEPFTVTVGSLWQNTAEPLNVDGQPGIVPLDALIIFNELNNRVFTNPVTGQLPAAGGPFGPAPYYDTDGDEFVTPLDALLVINHINAQAAFAGEGEAPAAVLAPPPVRMVQPPAALDAAAEDLLHLLASDVAARRRWRLPRSR
jgi:hypothetical protein